MRACERCDELCDDLGSYCDSCKLELGEEEVEAAIKWEDED